MIISRIPLILTVIMLLTHISYSQSCEAVVDLTVKAINAESATSLTDHLADDFKIAGQEAPIAKLVLGQLLEQLGDKVTAHNFTSSEAMEGKTILKYDFTYEKKGVQETTFIFNASCKISEMKLFAMEVKTMCSADSQIEASDSEHINIPFELLGKLILVQATLDGVQRNFLLDSGSPRVILNSKYVQNRDSLSKIISNTKGVNGSVSGIDIHKIDELDFHGIRMKDQEVVTADLSNLEEGLGGEIYGLIGYDMIKEHDILFDYHKNQIVLIQPEKTEAFLEKEYSGTQKEIIPFRLQNHIPVVTAQIGDKELSYGIDCGAETNLLDDDLFPSFEKETVNIKQDTLSGLGHIVKYVQSGDIEKTIFGNIEFSKLRTVFSDISHINEGYSLQLDGLIGYEVLARQPSLISFERKELILIME